MAYVTISTIKYAVEQITQYLVQPLSDAIRTTGTQQRSDNRKINKYPYSDWSRGLGHNRIRRDSGQGIGGFRDADNLTIFRSGVYLPRLQESQTHADPAQHLKKYVLFKGDYFGFFEETYNAAAVNRVVCNKWNPDVWDSAGTVETSVSGSGMRCWDAIAHETHMFAAVTSDGDDDGANSTVIARSTDGATWEETGTVTQVVSHGPLQAVQRRNKFDDDGARLLSFGATLMLAFHDTPSDHVTIAYSTDPEADSPTFTSGASIPSGDGPKALVRWLGQNSSGAWVDSPVLVIAEGVYRVDSAGTTSDLIFPLDGDPHTGRWSVVGQDGALWIPLGSGEILRLSIEGGILVVHHVLPPDRLLSTRQGFAHFLLAAPVPWLIVAYGGAAASQTTSVFAIDYTPQRDPVTGKLQWAWHSLYSEADANIDLYMVGYSTADDATPRLHFSLENATDAEMFHIEHPFTDPASGVTLKFQATGHIDWPEEDLGDPHADSVVLAIRADVDDLDAVATIEAGDGTDTVHIEEEYGLDGAAWNNVSNLGILASDDKVLFFGLTDQNTPSAAEAATPIGVSAKTIRRRSVFFRDGTNTKTPKLKELQVEANNKLIVLNGWILEVDLAKSAPLLTSGKKTPAEVLTNLETLRDLVPLTPFLIGEASTAYVHMVEGSWDLMLSEPGGGDGQQKGRRYGKATIRVEEVL